MSGKGISKVLPLVITERKPAEDLYRTLATNSPVGVYIAQEGKFVFINPQFQKYTGFTEGELLGRDALSLVHPEDRERVRESAVEMLKGKRSTPYEFRVIGKGGETIWAMETATSIYYKGIRATLGNLMDITGRRQMEEALRESEERNRSLVNNVKLGILRTTPPGRILEANPAMEEIIGYPREELLKMNVSKFYVHLEEREALVKALALTEGKLVRELRWRKKDGTEIVVLDTLVAVRDDTGKVLYFDAIIEDITERKRMEAKLEQKTKELEQANIRLQEMDRLKSIFLASMSHELRTPLNSIIGFTSLILEGMVGEINEEQRSQLTLVKCSADHLLGLINDVLDISKIEAGKVELSLEEFKLDDIIGEVVESFSPIANLKSIKVSAEVPGGITLFSDRRRVKQVLMNLVSNAVKFTEQGGVKVVARVLRDGILEISVIDTGTGIRKEDMARLFVPFQQVDESLTKKHEGTGLGLHLTRKIVTLLGGNISAKSEYGKGSEFTFTIPLQYVEVQKK